MAITKTGIRVDTDPYFSNPIVFEEDGEVTSIRATGLKNNTTYHVMGYVIEDGTKIFSKDTKTFNTLSDVNYFGLANTANGPNTITITKHDEPLDPGHDIPLPDITLEYTKDGENWLSWSSSNGNFSITLAAGEHIQFRGNNPRTIPIGKSLSSTQYYNFGSTATCTGSGDLNTLFNKNGGDREIPRLFFCSMFENMQYLENGGIILPTTFGRIEYFKTFEGCTSITNLPELPAAISGVIYSIDYSRMFKGCTGLTSIPSGYLPTSAEDASFRYSGMFDGCTGITSIPADLLPATHLRSFSYSTMFQGCTGLTSIPADLLPATHLKLGCYLGMFNGCTGLTSLPTGLLPATTLAEQCYAGMFEGCTGLTSVPKDLLPATNFESGATGFSGVGVYEKMFYGCSNLQNSPDLPVTVPISRMYHSMFYGCSFINEITTYAEDISATDCTTNWLMGVANSGTLNNFGDAAFTTDSPSGVPVGWTENKYDYFHITNLVEAPNAIALNKTGTPAAITLEYSKDKDTWTEWSSANGDLRLIIEDGETVWFRGNNSTFNGESSYYKFSAFFDIAAGGNCMSLLDKTMQQSTLPAYAFSRLFSGCTALKQIPDILPATSLMVGCYQYMFQGCTGITSLQSGLLPATTLESQCYMSMFQGCTGLTSLPSGLLPATTLESQCYMSMFQGCTGLTSLPSGLLPATTLESECYYNMFMGCTGLTSLPSGLLPATTLSDYCYDGMFRDCTGLTSLPSGLLPATSLSMYCYQNMFYGCTSITEIELPAPTPYYGCYSNMLRGCSSLNKIICYTADLSYGYSANWVNGAGNGSGDFYNLSGSTIPTGNNGIPTGWTEHTSL